MGSLTSNRRDTHICDGTTLRQLIAADDPDTLVKWVKEELLASYRRGVDKQKASDGTDTR